MAHIILSFPHLLASFGAGHDVRAQEVPRGDVLVAALEVHHLALGATPATGAAFNERNTKLE